MTSWVETRKLPAEKSNLVILFDKYIPSCLETVRNRFKKITPIADMAHVQMLCYLLDVLFVPENTPADCPKEWHDIFFVFACVWAFGSAMFQDTSIDYRVGKNFYFTSNYGVNNVIVQVLANYYIYYFQNSQSGGRMNLRILNFPSEERYSIITSILRPSSSRRGPRRFLNSNWILTYPYRQCWCRQQKQ